ncbi:WD-40 repeat [hydrothermal vent metagenome]|uniref:WD-40 repeat n=1 Tax=hydrothermal vent metagenome TaxID=652676 RepID=A0A1W1CTE4_9ZZZZ
MQQTKCLKFHADLLDIDTFNNGQVAVASRNQNIKIFLPQECKIIQNLYFDFLKENTTAIAFHPTQEIVAIANTTTLYILDTKERNILQTIAIHDGAIEIMTFLAKTPYLITGTTNGRVLQYRYEGRLKISRLCSFPYTRNNTKKSIKHNYVSAIAYNNDYLACSGYGGALTLVKLHSNAKKFSFEVSRSRINALCFSKNNIIIFANKEGVIFFAKLRKNAAITQIQTQQREIIQILMLWQSDFALIVSQSNTLALLNTKSKKMASSNFINFEKNIKKVLLIEENKLLVMLKDQTIVNINLPTTQQLRQELKRGNLLKAFTLLKENPMLQSSIEANKTEELYKKLYSTSFLKFLHSKNRGDLNKIKAEDYQNALIGAQNYEKLQNFYINYKFSLAYALCEKFPVLKFTPEYKKMEESYKKSFLLAQKYLLQQRLDKAKASLEPFATISTKRTMIQLLLRQNKHFVEFLQAVSKKEYTKIDSLLKTHPSFKEIPSYIALQQEIKQDLKKITSFIDNSEISQAISLIKNLQNIPFIKEELYYLYKRTEDAKKLLDYYEKDDFVQCYETLDANSELDSMQLAKLLEKHWNKCIDKCEKYALNGNIKAVKDTLGDLLQISTRKNKIGDLLRLSFHAKIKQEFQEHKYKQAENLIYSYIDIFGMDSEIKQLMQNFEQITQQTLAITLTQKKYKERNSWRYTDIK